MSGASAQTSFPKAGTWLGLQGKVAVVTGGASGIGRACCEALAAHGAKVVVADLDPASGEAAAAALRSTFGVEARFRKADVTKADDTAALFAATLEEWGRVDVLVNNAGINIPRLLVDPAGKEELTEAVWDKMVNVNLKGLFLCGQAAARAMLRGGSGVIVNMSSESGMEGSEGQSGYSATKAAVYGLTRSWAKELGKRGIRVVGIAPGILEVTGLRTPAYESALAYTRGITVEDLRKGYVNKAIPLGRDGKLSEVADLAAFLASERAGYIHGTVINISGGKSRE
ncbi:MAG: SDR family NAD(P)-dependent oxidoreductase [Fibrobacteres bacterium]|nr:SDR family NAD(P)-dependent oxidoreductase [Fibrobacterota bacterium]